MAVLVSPLATSNQAPLSDGVLYCLSMHNAAINLLTESSSQQQLLTLHNAGSGISPMGYALKQDDFFAIGDLLRQNTAISSKNQIIYLGNAAMISPRRVIDLSLKSGQQMDINGLKTKLQTVTAETGLFGSIGKIVNMPLTEPLDNFIDLFVASLHGQRVIWDPLIGLGPGLTPSSDDMLVGMLAVAWNHEHTRQLLTKQTVFFDNLQKLTTIISYNYLLHASHGYFSTPLLRVLKSANKTGKLSLAIDQLIQHGHTSGADTLLGIWLGTLAINRYFLLSRVASC